MPDSVANQIAAGEVIQRPASVIKELVENAIDAGAKTVNVVVVDAGRTLIQVTDDGKGMSETDARLSFERHATSKISHAEDLFNLHTMGFRGEALASIAAVAQVELRTRTPQSEIGTLLTIAGSKVVGQEPVSCPVGSTFKVENLFFNVPARRKFLKSNNTELNNIITAYERIVLVYPEVAFTLHSNNVEVLNLKSGNTRQRVVDVFGKKLNQELLPISVETSMCKISGFVGKPEAARKKGLHQYFFVNRRFMKHPYFHKAVQQAYERLIPIGTQVPYFIYFDVNPQDIDVNIHPTKTEIKFENEQAIWQILMAAVNDSIGQFCEVPSIDFDTEGQPDIPIFDPTTRVAPPQPSYNPNYNPFDRHNSSNSPASSDWQSLYEGTSKNEETGNPIQEDFFPMPESGESSPTLIAEKSPAHYQYKGKYIMTAVKSGLMIIDQHRADIRIRYDRYLNQMKNHEAGSQKVLFPETVQFAVSDEVIVTKLLPELSALGFDLEPLGSGSYAINGIPAGIEGLNYPSLLIDIVAEASERGTNNADELNRIIALSLARKAAITVGEVLDNKTMETLITELFSTSNVNYTPDGKAILCILPQRDIEQLLG